MRTLVTAIIFVVIFTLTIACGGDESKDVQTPQRANYIAEPQEFNTTGRGVSEAIPANEAQEISEKVYVTLDGWFVNLLSSDRLLINEIRVWPNAVTPIPMPQGYFSRTFVLYHGTTVELISDKKCGPDYCSYKIKTTDGRVGWVDENDIKECK